MKNSREAREFDNMRRDCANNFDELIDALINKIGELEYEIDVLEGENEELQNKLEEYER